MFTRIGGARKCLMVYVQGEELVITPNFPFTLMFLPEFFDLDVRVPIASISAIERTSSLIGQNLRITFAERDTPPIELKLRYESGFILHLGVKISNRPTT